MTASVIVSPNFASAAADVVSLEDWRAMVEQPSTPEEMLALAMQLEDEDHLEAAVEMYRAALLAFGPDAEINFLLSGELVLATSLYQHPK